MFPFSVVIGFIAACIVISLFYRDSSNLSLAKRKWTLPSDSERGWYEILSLKLALIWVAGFAYVLISGLWKDFGNDGYIYFGLICAAPYFIAPVLLEPKSFRRSGIPFYNRYWFRANVWIAFFGFIGNYLWTHYFYSLLRATYLLEAYRINYVPFCMFLYTHAYFSMYHSLTNMVLRRWWTSLSYHSLPFSLRGVVSFGIILSLALITAIMEAFTIQSYPLYDIKDRAFMYTVGAVIYGLYFIISFPAFYSIDENKPNGSPLDKFKASIGYTILHSLAASMTVTLLLDFWRVSYMWFTGVAPPGLVFFPPSDSNGPGLTWASNP